MANEIDYGRIGAQALASGLNKGEGIAMQVLQAKKNEILKNSQAKREDLSTGRREMARDALIYGGVLKEPIYEEVEQPGLFGIGTTKKKKIVGYKDIDVTQATSDQFADAVAGANGREIVSNGAIVRKQLRDLEQKNNDENMKYKRSALYVASGGGKNEHRENAKVFLNAKQNIEKQIVALRSGQNAILYPEETNKQIAALMQELEKARQGWDYNTSFMTEADRNAIAQEASNENADQPPSIHLNYDNVDFGDQGGYDFASSVNFRK
jgi:hypothetical protein